VRAKLARGVRGKGAIAWFLLPLRLLIAFWQSSVAIFRVRPDVVLSMGGYVAFPGGMMASLLARPLAVHEQNAIAGLSNRVLAGVADRVMVAFPDTLRGAEWTGNPVRAEIETLPPPAERFAGRSGPLNVLVVGGSLGARVLNETMPAALSRLDAAQRPHVVHQSGVAHIEAVRASYEDGLTDEQYNDPHYAYRVLFVPKTANRKGQADAVMEFVKPGSEEAEQINRYFFKETEKEKFKPRQIVRMMKAEGFTRFGMQPHPAMAGRQEPRQGLRGHPGRRPMVLVSALGR